MTDIFVIVFAHVWSTRGFEIRTSTFQSRLLTKRSQKANLKVVALQSYARRDYSGVSAAQELGYHDTSKYWQR